MKCWWEERQPEVFYKRLEHPYIKFCRNPQGLFLQLPWLQVVNFKLQGILVSKLTLGPFLTLSIRNGPNLQSYLFQEYISLNFMTLIFIFEHITIFETFFRISAHVTFSEHILVLRQLPEFISMSISKHLRTT